MENRFEARFFCNLDGNNHMEIALQLKLASDLEIKLYQIQKMFVTFA